MSEGAQFSQQDFAGINLPRDFALGTAIAAYQIEGAAFEGGRGSSIWDVFSHTPGKTAKGDTGDVADDHYHRFAEDIALMKRMGLRHYRMSLSWSRLLPYGTLKGGVNKVGVEFYKRLMKSLRAEGINIAVTAYHWDLPTALHEKGGWLNKTLIVDAFTDYMSLCFELFGEDVSQWITFNEVSVFAKLGYGSGTHAPGRCTGCSEGGDSSREPYIVAHNVLLSHASAVAVFRAKYAPRYPQSKIGITLNSGYYEPRSNRPEDIQAAERVQIFDLGWFTDPIFFGDYAEVMKHNIGDRLPAFSDEEKKMLKGSLDFLGINYYTSRYVANDPSSTEDQRATAYDTDEQGNPIGPRADSDWLLIYPPGIRKLLVWVARRYANPLVYITENGVDVPDEDSIPLPKVLNDTYRIDYVKAHLQMVSAAAEQDGVNVKGYYLWSFLDNFEWADGYSKRFGIHFVDYKQGLTRHAKQSAEWYATLITQHRTRFPDGVNK